jgi:hypothetical protein
MYTKKNEDNPKYLGKSLFDILCENDSFFSEKLMNTYIFDGDTIEFINSNFYKQNINSVINELKKNKDDFINRFQRIFTKLEIFKEYGKIDFCRTNYPFVSFLTNKNHWTVFNNMTYHFNFTLPTKLDEKCNIKFNDWFIINNYCNTDDRIYKYMVNNFESMFDSELSIKHFHIRPGLFGLWSDADDIKEEYSKNIQLDCIRWIKNELIKEQLFNSTNWIPIQDSDD